ncbi:cytochrome P450 6a22 [Drosophila miranda]|uniref:cytochrome P450 6a22 n=1 Tax=Drosophila miranda TaxID=7229 RepID=UPI0007E6CA32|nr:cytochrome P450 6a22 [Drosophila miranda]
MGFVLILLTSLLSGVLGYLRCKYNYWQINGVKQLRAHFLFGHFFKMKSVRLTELLQETYDAFKGSALVAGTYVYLRPTAVILDLDLAKTILIKDFDKFVDRRNFHKEPLTDNLFNAQGEEWCTLRKKLTPMFSSGNLKCIFGTITEVARNLEESFQELVGTQGGVLDVHDLLDRFSMDASATCAFGIHCNSLKDPQVEFRVHGRKIFHHSDDGIRWRIFKFLYWSVLAKLKLPVRFYDKIIVDFFTRIAREKLELRKLDNIKRNDFLELLMASKDDNDLTLEQLTPHAFDFFVSGYETSSSTMTCALFELAKHPSVQQKLRNEITGILHKHASNLTYEAMQEMRYLDQTITETLRKYPALASLTRIATEDYTVPTASGDIPLVLDKGTIVHIPVRAIHYDSEIYPEPTIFRPERFETSTCLQRHSMAFLGFGDGPRHCIGQQFGRMQIKIGLIALLTKYQFSSVPGFPDELPISKGNVILRPRQGVFLLKVHRVPE